MIDREDAKILVKDYLFFLADQNRVTRVPIYNSWVKHLGYKIAIFFNKEVRYIVTVDPDYFKKVKVYDESTNFVINRNYILENEFSWGFGWDSEKYLRTKNQDYSIIGNGLIIIDKSNGRLYQSPTFRGYDFMLDDFAKDKKGEESRVAWDYKLRIKQGDRWMSLAEIQKKD